MTGTDYSFGQTHQAQTYFGWDLFFLLQPEEETEKNKQVLKDSSKV